MKKHLHLGFAVILTASAAFAQETNEPVVADVHTTATAQRATTATEQLAENTTASAAVGTQLGEERFQKQWEREESLYREAGISEEKINRLQDLNRETWEARARGEKVDFSDLTRKRAEILDIEDSNKLRELRRKAINDRLAPADAQSTVTAVE